nr:hypothetical protein Q903MT_gene3685 [Picea sitchensis]
MRLYMQRPGYRKMVRTHLKHSLSKARHRRTQRTRRQRSRTCAGNTMHSRRAEVMISAPSIACRWRWQPSCCLHRFCVPAERANAQRKHYMWPRSTPMVFNSIGSGI